MFFFFISVCGIARINILLSFIGSGVKEFQVTNYFSVTLMMEISYQT